MISGSLRLLMEDYANAGDMAAKIVEAVSNSIQGRKVGARVNENKLTKKEATELANVSVKTRYLGASGKLPELRSKHRLCNRTIRVRGVMEWETIGFEILAFACVKSLNDINRFTRHTETLGKL